eukprot:3051697-Pleurochrysis_carterae.AAC.2
MYHLWRAYAAAGDSEQVGASKRSPKFTRKLRSECACPDQGPRAREASAGPGRRTVACVRASQRGCANA